MLINLLILSSGLFMSPVWAARTAVVITDGAIVYRKSNFDSPVIGYFKKGQKVLISSKLFGPFYRVRFRQGVLGYISDVDVSTKKKGIKKGLTAGSKESKLLKKSGKKTKVRQPLGARPNFGVIGGVLNYSEVILRKEPISSISVFGVKITWPLHALGSFILDTNFLYHGGAPDFYKADSSTTPTGSILSLDFQMQFILAHFAKRNGIVYAASGPLFNYSAIKATIANQALDLKELRLGMSFTLGIAYRFYPIVIRLEPKAYFERTNFWGAQLSLQFEI